MKSILDLPSEIRDQIFSTLDIYTLSLLSQTCRGLSRACQSIRVYAWNSVYPSSVIERLPHRYPLLTRLDIAGEFKIEKPFAIWDQDHSSLCHVTSDTFWIAPHLLKCTQLTRFDYKSMEITESHGAFFTSQFVPIMSRLLPRLSVAHIKHTMRKPSGAFEHQSLQKPILCPHLTDLTLQIVHQPLEAIHDFFSAFAFPALTTLSLGNFDQVPEGMDWPEFVFHLKSHFPNLLHLELSHLYADITDFLPPGLVSLSWTTWLPREDWNTPLPGSTEFFLSKFIDVNPRLTKLLLRVPENGHIHDDLSKPSYPSIVSLDIDHGLDELYRFPSLTNLKLNSNLDHQPVDVFQDICYDCPQLEHLELSLEFGFLSLAAILDENDFPWLANLTFLSVSTRTCHYGTLAKLICHHPKLETFCLITNRLHLDNFDAQNLEPLSYLKEFRLFIGEHFVSQNSVDVLHFLRQSRSLYTLDVSGLVYSPVTVDFPSYWPRLQSYKHDGLVTAEYLRAWALNTFWPSSLVSLSISMHNLETHWFELLGLLETHYTLRTCIVAFNVNENDSTSLSDLSEQQNQLLKEWNPKLTSDSRDWKSRVERMSKKELSYILSILSPDERTKDVDPMRLRRVAQAILTCRFCYRIWFALYLYKE